MSVKHENFKTCAQSGFCKRNRALADDATAATSSWKSPYQLDSKSIKFDRGQFTGTVFKTLKDGEKRALPLTITFLESGLARVVLDEEKRQKGDIELRHSSKARKERYNDVDKWAIVGGLDPSKSAAIGGSESGTTVVKYGPVAGYEAVIKHSPFGIDFKRDGHTHIRFNERGLLNMEHWRQKIDPPEQKEGEESPPEDPNKEDESTWWDESFGGNTDSKPRGPESIGLDISFPGYEHVYGIPEHASSLSLKETRGGDGKYSDPYRLYNSDVFEYELDSPMTLYGAIPFMQAHRKDSTVGVLWLNAAETWVDIIKNRHTANQLSLGTVGTVDTQTHWFSESGLLDVVIFLGPSPQEIAQKYGALTGYTQLPQSFAIAYHQCRWNYVTDTDIIDVDRRMDKHKIPYDVIWLDIEYTDGKKYFTWDPLTFPNPEHMHKTLDKHERKQVVIIDPHIKNTGDYPVVEELKSKDLAVHNKEGNIYEGWCWPGSSHWIDAFNPKAIEWWKSLFQYNKFKGTFKNTFLWNDMNEPSVFNGPETTMPKDNLHHGSWEHRDVHNVNGLTFVNATYEALLHRDDSDKKYGPRRPFVLTRSFYVGSQRMGAMWTGDNLAEWSHLKVSIPMILNQGISGFPFAGADVGGFFGNPSKELLTRWYQAGAFYPFFRGHAHIDTRRREPYVAGEPYTGIMTAALRLRYALLPAWYTAFHEASTTGAPILRPNFYVHPGDEKGFALDDQYYVGSTGLLSKPVTAEGQDKVDIYLADGETYYDYFDYTAHTGKAGRTVSISAPLERIPLLMQGGHIIPRRDRPRRSSGLMRYDPFTLVVVVGKDGNAEGTLYLDDGESFDYEQGGFIHRKFTFSSATNTLSSEDIASFKGAKTPIFEKAMKDVTVEKIILVNAPSGLKGKQTVAVSEEKDGKSEKTNDVKLGYVGATNGAAAWAVVKDPKVRVASGWKIEF